MGMGFAASLSAALCRLQRAGAGRSALCEDAFPALRPSPEKNAAAGSPSPSAFRLFPTGRRSAPSLTGSSQGTKAPPTQLAALMIARWEARGLAVPDIAAFVPAKPGQYGQAEALARRIGPVLGAKVLDHFLTRHQNSRVQHTLPMEEQG